jgi:hypothetical protein
MWRDPFRIGVLWAVLVFCGGLSANKEHKEGEYRLGSDVYYAGDEVGLKTDAGDAFLAGSEISVTSKITGTVHAAGRRIELNGPVQGNAYAAGGKILVNSNVAGSASLAGKTVKIAKDASIGNTLRAIGNKIVLGGNVTGYALLTGNEVHLDGKIGGDVRVHANHLSFGKDAHINGKLTYCAPERLDIPTHVVDPANVVYEPMRKWDFTKLVWLGLLGLVAFLVVSFVSAFALGLLLLLILPKHLERWLNLGRPLYTAFIGLGALAAFFVGTFVLAMTGIGLLVAVPLLLVLPLGLMVSYVVGVYLLASLIWRGIFNKAQRRFWPRLGIFALGLIVFSALGLIPVLGTLLSIYLVSLGIGSAIRGLRASERL